MCAHAFIYRRFRRVGGPDATSRRDRASFVRHDYRHERRLDLHTQLLQFNGKYTREPHIHSHRMRGELSVEIAPLRLMFAFEKIAPRSFRTALILTLIALQIPYFLQIKLSQFEKSIATHAYAHHYTASSEI